MVQAKKAIPYYNYNKLFSYNGHYNMVVGGRGIGKSYGAKVRAVRNAIKKKEMFIYLRRYKTELTASKETFFADIASNFPDHDFRINRFVCEMSPVSERETGKKRQWQKVGYFFALSTAQSLKSVSFPDVTLIIFDEFIIEKGAFHYLPNEVTIFNNFYSTVARTRENVKVLFLANSVSIMNPYMIEWKIDPDDGQEWIIKASGFLVCHFPESKAYQTAVYETAFGRFIAGTDYADYAYGNQFADNNDALLGERHYKAKYKFSLETDSGLFSVWHDSMAGEYYVEEKQPKDNIVFTLVSQKMDKDKILITYSDAVLSTLRTAFRQAKVIFDSPSARNIFADIFKR